MKSTFIISLFIHCVILFGEKETPWQMVCKDVHFMCLFFVLPENLFAISKQRQVRQKLECVFMSYSRLKRKKICQILAINGCIRIICIAAMNSDLV